MSFLKLNLQSEYRSLREDVVKNFYNPVLNEAVLYKRAVGFFSSSALIAISSGICGLIKNGGKIYVIASPRLSEADLGAINAGFQRREEIIKNALLRELQTPQNIFEENRLNLLSNLIAVGKLDFKIAFLEENNSVGMFHEKLGLIHDAEGNIIAFSGSVNESANAFQKNYESIDIFTSWTHDAGRVKNKISAFDALWNNSERGVKVLKFPEVREEILKKYKINNKIDTTLDDADFKKISVTVEKNFVEDSFVEDNFIAKNLSKTLLENFKYRLALSATIDRHGDEEGTQKLYNYFGEKCIEYNLSDAIKNDMLTPYRYFPVVVSLNEVEREEYLNLTAKIRQGIKFDKHGKIQLTEFAKMLLIKRARLVAGAEEKISVLREKIQDFKNDNQILVYCGATTLRDVDYHEGEPIAEEIRQIDAVVKMLGLELNMRVSKFTSQENSAERELLKKNFEEGKHLQALVAIRCLDDRREHSKHTHGIYFGKQYQS